MAPLDTAERLSYFREALNVCGLDLNFGVYSGLKVLIGKLGSCLLRLITYNHCE